jgi:hypothetical protein
MNCQKCDGTLDTGDAGCDEEITVLDIDSILHKTWSGFWIFIQSNSCSGQRNAEKKPLPGGEYWAKQGLAVQCIFNTPYILLPSTRSSKSYN